MFTGVNFEKAIDYWKKGREVIVIDRNSKKENGGYDNFPFEDLFRNVELLADVPAVENPEFSQTVDKMVHGRGQKQEELSGDREADWDQVQHCVFPLEPGQVRKEAAKEGNSGTARGGPWMERGQTCV